MKNTLRLSVTALMSALCYIGFTYIKISIPTPAGSTAFHFGNVFCVLAALLLGGVTGGIAGAIGMGIGDLMDPRYVMVAPKTIILKLMIGIIAGTVAHKYFHIKELSGKALTRAAVVSTACGMFFNICAEPIFGYLYYQYIIDLPEKAAKTLAGFNLVTTSVNAVIAVIISSILYIELHKRFNRSQILKDLSK